MKLYNWQIYFFFENAKRFNALPAGRRTGKTKGAANSALMMLLEELTVFWVDENYNNIIEYFEQYFKPELDEMFAEELLACERDPKSPKPYKWHEGRKKLTIHGREGFMKFGSADNPKSLEGFAYDRIFVNEAGLVARAKENIFSETLFPMMIENKNAQLFAIGTPKGKWNKDGKSKNSYFKLFEKALEGSKIHQYLQLRSDVNPAVDEDAFQILVDEYDGLHTKLAQQELCGQFVEFGGDCLFTFLNYIEEEKEHPEYKLAYIDWAGDGKDYLCMPYACRYGKEWHIEDVYHSNAHQETTEAEVIAFIRKHRITHVIVETNSGGAGLFHTLNKEFRNDNWFKIDGFHESENKEDKIVGQKRNIQNIMRFRKKGTHSEMYDLFLRHILSYETMVKNQIDDAPDSIASMSRVIFEMFKYLYA